MLGINKYSDHKVLEEIRKGNEEMLEYLYLKHTNMVKSFILKNNGTEEDVSEILQETVIAAWQNMMKPSFLLQSKISTYLMAIAKNLWYKELKKRSRFTVVDESLKERPETDKNNPMDLALIRQLVDDLDDTCKELLSLFYFDGMDQKAIADRMGFANAQTVKAKKYQCFKRLEKAVKKDYKKSDFI
jgi:RNA polymerase sigma factor (sigma-70 family)